MPASCCSSAESSFTPSLAFWGVIHGIVPRADRWSVVASEMLLTVMSLPQAFIDFRHETRGLVICTDASEQGGAVCVSRALSPSGEEQLLR